MPRSWEEIFAALDKAGFEDFLKDREQGEYEKREPLLLVLEPPLTDEEFEQLSMRTELASLERAADGRIMVNPLGGGNHSSANVEISYQLGKWEHQHRRGRAHAHVGCFLPDSSMLSPDAAYSTPEQVKSLPKGDHFLRFAPAFVIELKSASDSLDALQAKMANWIANGAQLGWLIDPYHRHVWVYEAGQEPRLVTGDKVEGSGPVAGFKLELADLWSEYDD